MNLECSVDGISHLTSRSQQVRVMTESWFGRSAYCISCPSEFLKATKANTVAHDFLCDNCGQCYELKSSGAPEKNRIVDGAYGTMIGRIRTNRAPSLILLQYDRDVASDTQPWRVERLVAIHPIFLTEAVIEARKPLSVTATAIPELLYPAPAKLSGFSLKEKPPCTLFPRTRKLWNRSRRAGWQGCNIRLDRVPIDGRIEMVRNGCAVDKKLVREKFASAQRLATLSVEARGWTGLVLAIVRRLGATFNLQQVYAARSIVEEAFPHNRNIEAKLRQQLQILRDLGFIEFLGRGKYATADK